MAKIDKSKYSKDEWKKIRAERRAAKARKRYEEDRDKSNQSLKEALLNPKTKTAFVLGNGTSRKGIDPELLRPYGKIYGCNALYREFEPDYLIAVDVKMILEINKAGYQHNHEVWTNPNKSYHKIKGLNVFHPSKGWSSGPTALWLATQHQHEKVFILGFDYQGLEDGKRLNNIYADTPNYKKSMEGATFFGNWLRQTQTVIKDNPHTTYYRVIQPDNYIPDQLNSFANLKTIFVEDFKKMFDIS